MTIFLLLLPGTALSSIAPDISESEALNEIETIIDGKNTSMLPLLRKFVEKSPHPRVRSRAIGAIMILHDTDSLPLILNRLARDRSPEVRRAAALALSEMKSILTISPLIESATTDPDPLVRAACARALGFQGNSSGGRVLISLLLGDPSYEVRIEAAVGMGALKLREGIEPLKLAASKDPEKLVRLASIQALQEMGDRTLIPFLEEQFRIEPDQDVRVEIYLGILALKGDRNVVEEGMRSKDERIRFAALQKLIEISSARNEEKLPQDILNLLNDMLSDEFRGIRELAKYTLESWGFRVKDLGVRYEMVK